MRALGSLAGLPCRRQVRCCCGTERISHRRTNQRAGADGKLGTFAALSLVSEVDCLRAPVHWHFDLQVKTAHLDETSLQACIVANHAVPVHSYTGRALGATSLAALSWTLHGQARRNSQGTRNEIDLPLAARGHSAPSAERPWPYGHVLWAEDRHSGPTPGQRMEEDIENVPIGAEATRHGELGSYP